MERNYRALQLILIIDYDISEQLYSEIEQLIIEEAVLASERDSHDDAIQNQTEINMLEWMGENPADYPQRQSSRNNVMEIDIEKNPGYMYKALGYRLGASYRMWFGVDSYEIFDRDILKN